MACLFSGCGSAEVRGLERALTGRWTGGPVDPPAQVWFEHASFDVWFDGGGGFSAVARTFAGKPYELHFEGDYDVESATRVKIEDCDLGGEWTVERRGADEMTIAREGMRLALRKRLGS